MLKKCRALPAAFVPLLAAFLMVNTAAPSDCAESGWPMYQRSADHNAVVDRPGFSAKWTYDASGRINSGLAIVGDRVIFDTFDGKVVALDLRSGRPVWTANTDNVVMSTPVVVGSTVYVGTGHNGTMSKQRTSFVYTAAPGRRQLDMWGRAEGDHVIAFDLVTGRRLWAYRTAGEDMPSPTVADGVVVFANGDFHAYGLRSSDGTALWQRDLGGISTMASAMRSGSGVLVGICSGPHYRGNTVALEPHTGRILWRSPYGDCDSTATVANGRIFTSGVDGNDTAYGHGARGVVAALDPRDGHTLWSFRTRDAGPYTKIGSNERAIAGTYANGTYFQPIPTSDELIAFDASRGRVKWHFKTQGPAKMSPVVKDGRLYIGDTVGLFYTIDARSGKLIRVTMFDEPFSTSPPVLVGNTIVVAGNTKVFALPQ
ncbi:MAG: PQQ-binding-like beta-propeller repeat protein [Candidatus Eremiobacteraeota bacterium]|nr:PQQ-binding-like beta-propeller repeat protein [Candidatus Eremiobacteraeota bacterium]